MIETERLVHSFLDQLSFLDSELAATIGEKLREIRHPIDPEVLTWLVDDAAWGLSMEETFGREIAWGYARLIADSKTGRPQMSIYRSMVREFGGKGPTVGRIMAAYLPSVLLCHDDDVLRQYVDTFNIMYQKGSYSLKKPLEGARAILDSGDLASSLAYLSLLYDAFSQDISYNRSLQLTYILPKAAGSFSHSKRSFQLQELSRIVRKDISLTEDFLAGLERGLRLLSKENLESFVLLSFDRYDQDPLMGKRFLSLASKLASEMCSNMQVSAPLSQVQHRLSRYVRARTGLNVVIKPFSALSYGSDHLKNGDSHVFSDGSCIYLPDEIDTYDNGEQNSSLFWHLARLESGQLEFGTFDFDFEKAMMRCRDFFTSDKIPVCDGHENNRIGLSDLSQFLQLFSCPNLASALFTIYEHGRIRLLLSQRYPGLVKRSLPIFQKEAGRICRSEKCRRLLSVLYARIALGMSVDEPIRDKGCEPTLAERISRLFEERLLVDSRVETSAELVCLTHDNVFNHLLQQGDSVPEAGQPMLNPPFGRVVRPDWVTDRYLPFAALAVAVREKLRKKGIRVFKSDIRRKLMQNQGALSTQDIQDVVVKMGPVNKDFAEISGGLSLDLDGMERLELNPDFEIVGHRQDDSADIIARYPEWDFRINDYLEDHVRVVDRAVSGCEGTFYSDTLLRYRGLAANMRRAFEMLKPEGLAILRQWVEGDHFDYRALLDFAIDRKVGRVPSDRLYIKREKQRRDVAVMILVDLSRSTANKAVDSSATVLDIEKEAIVLFSEALRVVGDRFAIAGFSGTGRLSVDYLRIKDFREAPGEEYHRRINAMMPQRSTRMGAAIRHAVSELEKIPAKVRILMTIGDGFPNDVGYKQGYAIADTRKAVHEAQSKQIYFRAITVNIAGDPKLDDLYGPFNHNVISDIRELPDKLLWIYSAMTKM